MKKIRIVLRKDGSQSLEVIGAEGDECIELTAELERRLGSIDGVRELKPEFDAETTGTDESEVEHE